MERGRGGRWGLSVLGKPGPKGCQVISRSPSLGNYRKYYKLLMAMQTHMDHPDINFVRADIHFHNQIFYKCFL